MKKIIFIFSALVLLSSCSSPEKKAKKAIKEYLKFALNDFKSYEPVAYGKIEGLNSSIEDLPEYISNNALADFYFSKSNHNNSMANIYVDSYSKEGRDECLKYLTLARKSLDSSKYFDDKVKAIEKSFISEFIGWQMIHTFRARIPAGGFKLNQYLFYFDKKFSKVTKSIDLSEI